jgi:hypothetical protein
MKNKDVIPILIVASLSLSQPIYARRAINTSLSSDLNLRDISIRARVDNLTLAQLDLLYDNILPQGSRGREANNPGWFRFFLEPGGYNWESWPYAILCIDIETDEITWHIACNDWPLKVLTFNFTSTSWVNTKNSVVRGKPLRSIEIIWRRYDSKRECCYYEHHFFPITDEY